MKLAPWVLPSGLALLAGAALGLWSFAGIWPAGQWWPTTWSLRGWQIWLSPTSRLGAGLVGSLVNGFGCLLVCWLVAWPAARFLAVQKLRFFRWVEIVLLTPIFFPVLVWLPGLHAVVLHGGLSDTRLGVFLGQAVLAYPYLLRALISGYQVLDPRLSTQGKSLGASVWRRWWSIELPLLSPSLVTGSLLVLLVSWSDYLVLFLIGGGQISGLALTVYPYAFSDERALASAAMITYSVIPLGLYLLLELWLSRRGRRLANHKGAILG